MTKGETILKEALKLKSGERAILIDMLIQSIDQPDMEINAIWVKEAEERLESYRKGNTKGIPYGDVFGEES